MLEKEKQQKKFSHCEKCHGCTHTLASIDTEIRIFNSKFVHRNGKSRAWAFESNFAYNSSSLHGEYQSSGGLPTTGRPPVYFLYPG